MHNPTHPGMHVAIIMDGNGRWATHRNLPRVAGHRAGVAAVRRVVEHAPTLDVRTLTLYAFSSDNWARPPQEVKSIFWIIRAFLRLECERLRQQGVRLEAIGRRDRIPRPLLREIERTESLTSSGATLNLRIAIDYSARTSIAAAAAAGAAPSWNCSFDSGAGGYRPAAGRLRCCHLWDRTAQSAPATAPTASPAPSPPETVPGAWSCRTSRTPQASADPSGCSQIC